MPEEPTGHGQFLGSAEKRDRGLVALCEVDDTAKRSRVVVATERAEQDGLESLHWVCSSDPRWAAAVSFGGQNGGTCLGCDCSLEHEPNVTGGTIGRFSRLRVGSV